MAVVTAKTTSELKKAVLTGKHILYAVGFISALCNILMLVSPIYMLQLYDRVLTSGNMNTLIAISAIVVFLMVMYGMLESVRTRLMSRLSDHLENKLADRVFDVMFKTSIARTKVASLPLRDFDTVRTFITSPSFISIFDVPWIPFYMLIVYAFHPLQGIVATIGSTIIIILAIMTEFLSRRVIREASSYASMSTSFAEVSLRNADVLQAMGMLEYLRRRWHKMRDQSINLMSNANERLNILTSASKSARMLLQSAMLGVGGYLVILQEISAGLMIAGSIMMGRALAPVEAIMGNWRGVVTARGSYQRLTQLLHTNDNSEAEPMALPDPVGEITAEGVYGGPPGSRTAVIKNVSLKIPAGKMLGVIGPSAAGKTTLGRMIVGVWNPLSGVIRLDGADVTLIAQEDRSRHTGYLPQDVELFNGTVAENICRFDTFSKPEEIVAAAKLAGCHDMILRLAKGYMTVVGDDGSMLSGGQRQRVGLARALFRTPRLIVLDEPNSNLDPEGNQALAAALVEMKNQGSTLIVIAHNLDVLRIADQVLVLKEGVVADVGPTNDILERYVRRRAA